MERPLDPFRPNFKAGNPRIGIKGLEMVSQLIMEGGDRWNEDLVKGVFEGEDTESILQISLKASQNEDYPF